MFYARYNSLHWNQYPRSVPLDMSATKGDSVYMGFPSYLPLQCISSGRATLSRIYLVVAAWIFSVSGYATLRYSSALSHPSLRMHLQMTGPIAYSGFAKAHASQSISVLQAPQSELAMSSVHPRLRRCRYHPKVVDIRGRRGKVVDVDILLQIVVVGVVVLI